MSLHMPLEVVGIDPSLTALGYADGLGTVALDTKVVPYASPEVLVDRLRKIRRLVLDLFDRYAWPELVVYEGYSYASPNGAHQIGELGGVLKFAMLELGVRFVLVTPQQRAMFATGKGNASKDAVCMAVAARLGRTFPSNDHVDAYLLRQMALHAYGETAEFCPPKENMAALAAVPWPTIEVGPIHPYRKYAPVVVYKAPPKKKGRAVA